jgi:hypothetical protein
MLFHEFAIVEERRPAAWDSLGQHHNDWEIQHQQSNPARFEMKGSLLLLAQSKAAHEGVARVEYLAVGRHAG